MKEVYKGGYRQELHERIRVHSMEAGKQVKVHGLENDLLERISNDKVFNLSDTEINELLDPSLYIGRSVEQVDEYLADEIAPILKKYEDFIGSDVKLKV
jgi:adenylosuccinate lyase